MSSGAEVGRTRAAGVVATDDPPPDPPSVAGVCSRPSRARSPGDGPPRSLLRGGDALRERRCDRGVDAPGAHRQRARDRPSLRGGRRERTRAERGAALADALLQGPHRSVAVGDGVESLVELRHRRAVDALIRRHGGCAHASARARCVPLSRAPLANSKYRFSFRPIASSVVSTRRAGTAVGRVCMLSGTLPRPTLHLAPPRAHLRGDTRSTRAAGARSPTKMVRPRDSPLRAPTPPATLPNPCADGTRSTTRRRRRARRSSPSTSTAP